MKGRTKKNELREVEELNAGLKKLLQYADKLGIRSWYIRLGFVFIWLLIFSITHY